MSQKLLKRCIKCDETKVLTDFKKDKHRADGYRNVCLTCHNKKRVGYNKKYKEKFKQKHGGTHAEVKEAKRLGISVEMLRASRLVSEEVHDKRKILGIKMQPYLKQIAFENNVMVTEKDCFMCGDVKSVTEFYSSKTHMDGYEGRCIQCNSNKAKKYRPSAESRKHKQEYDKQYRQDKKIQGKEKKVKEAKDEDLVFTRLDTKMTAEVLDDTSYKMKIYLMALMSVVHEVDGDVKEKILILHEAMSAEVADVKSVAVSLEFCVSMLK